MKAKITDTVITCSFCGCDVPLASVGGEIDRMKRHFTVIDGRRRECFGYRLTRTTMLREPELKAKQAERAGIIRLQRRLTRYGN